MKNDLLSLSEELIKSVHALEGFKAPLIEEELVRNLSDRLDELTNQDKEERVKALRNMFALGQICNDTDSAKEQAKTELIDVLYSQVIDLSMMSKIELGDDVIAEIIRLKKLINPDATKDENK